MWCVVSLCCAATVHAVLCVAGSEAAAAYVRSTGIKLCALGVDGQVLEQAGLKVRPLCGPQWISCVDQKGTACPGNVCVAVTFSFLDHCSAVVQTAGSMTGSHVVLAKPGALS